MAGLSQDELAVLVGQEGRSAISYYESGQRIPELVALMALELVFDVPLQKLFAGIACEVRTDVVGRARALLEGMGEKPTQQNAEKLRTLARLAYLDEEATIPW